MQPRSGIVFIFVAVIAVALGGPLFDKLHPNRDERFQIKDAGEKTSKICTTLILPRNLRGMREYGLLTTKVVGFLQVLQFPHTENVDRVGWG